MLMLPRAMWIVGLNVEPVGVVNCPAQRNLWKLNAAVILWSKLFVTA